MATTRPTIDPTSSGAPTPVVQPTEAESRALDLEAQDQQAEAGEGASEAARREEKIRQKAYEAYVRRGLAPGHETEDWLEAERAVDQESGGDGSRKNSGSV